VATPQAGNRKQRLGKSLKTRVKSGQIFDFFPFQDNSKSKAKRIERKKG
jgi:hypothetical protein